MDATEQSILEKQIRISASPETVFSFFTDPAKLVRWKGIQAELDPHPGGIYRVDINGRDVIRGKYVEVVPYTRIVFTWGLEGEGSPLPPGSTTVEITLIPEAGGTLVRLRHLGLPPEQRQAHADGWDFYLSRLTQAAEGRQVSPNESFM
jgi:uncharacterized protein YndB with AHSA1/START domain